MSDHNFERKSSRTSILKPRKSVSEANDSVSECREVRRVSFASSNFVKPFAADPEKNTIWDNTYEEEVHTDSARSDHFDEEGFLDITLKNLKESNKENYVPTNPFLTEDSIKLSDSVFRTNPLELEKDELIKFNLEQDMEITDVLSNVPIVNTNKIVACSIPKDTVSSNNIKEEDMEFTCVFPIQNNEVSKNLSNQTHCKNKAIKLSDKQNMKVQNKHQNFTSSSRKSIGNVTTIDNMETSMQFTCVLADTDIMDMTCINENENILPHLKNKQTDKRLAFQNVTKEPLDMELTCVPSSRKSILESSMQFTCVSPESKSDENVLPEDMELTCAFTNINKKNNETDQNLAIENVPKGPLESKKTENSLNFNPESTKKILKENSNMPNLQEQTISQAQDTQSTSLKKSILETSEQYITSDDKALQEDMEFPRPFMDLPKSDRKIEPIEYRTPDKSLLTSNQNLNLDGTDEDVDLTPTVQKEHSSYHIIYHSSILVNDEKIDADSDKFKLKPGILHVEDAETSYAMSLNSSIFPENLGKNIDNEKDKTKSKQPYLDTSTESSELKQTADNLADTISVEYSLSGTSPPRLVPSEIECSIMDSSNLQEVDPNGIFMLIKQAKDIINLPKVKLPEFPVNLFKKIEEADLRTLQLLEGLKFKEIEIIDLEELDRCEEEFGSSASRLSDGIISADSGSNNAKEDTEILDLPVPKTLEELVKEMATRSESYWEFVKSENDCYRFHSFFGVVSFEVKVHPDKGLVDEILLYNNLQDDEMPLLHYLAQYLQNKLKKENLQLPLGDKFDLLTFLDYVSICVDEVRNFFVEFNKLVDEYGPTHKFRMNPDFTVIVEVMKIKVVMWWVITLNISTTNIGSITQINVKHIYEEVDENEKHIRNIRNKLEGPKYLRSFILHLEEYIEKVSKQVVARRENELLNIW